MSGSTDRKSPEQANPQRRRADEWAMGERRAAGQGFAEWAQGFSWGDKNAWNSMVALDAQHVKTPKAAESYTLRW